MQSDGARPSPARVKEEIKAFCSEEIALHWDLTLRGRVDWDYGVTGRAKDVTKE